MEGLYPIDIGQPTIGFFLVLNITHVNLHKSFFLIALHEARVIELIKSIVGTFNIGQIDRYIGGRSRIVTSRCRRMQMKMIL